MEIEIDARARGYHSPAGRPVIAMLALLAQATGAPPTEPVPEEVVVTARRGQCDISIADRLISDREFRAKAKEWAAGRPVRIVVPRGASIRCEADIMFKLNRHGVTRAVFVER